MKSKTTINKTLKTFVKLTKPTLNKAFLCRMENQNLMNHNKSKTFKNQQELFNSSE